MHGGFAMVLVVTAKVPSVTFSSCLGLDAEMQHWGWMLKCNIALHYWLFICLLFALLGCASDTRCVMQGHALFVRHAGGVLPCPQVDFTGGFNGFLAAAYGLGNTTVEQQFGSAFDPFMNDQNFVLSADSGGVWCHWQQGQCKNITFAVACNSIG